MKLDRRGAILALFGTWIGFVSGGRPVVAEDTRIKLGRWKFKTSRNVEFDLDRIRKLIVTRHGKRVEVSRAEIWKALGGEGL